MTNEQLVFAGIFISALLSYITSRTSASSGAVAALVQTIQTLRAELNEAEETRKKDRDEFMQALEEERKKRIELERKLNRYKKYINTLVEVLTANKIPVPSPPPIELEDD